MKPINRAAEATSFQPLPEGERLAVAWPTLNRLLFSAPQRFLARTRANPDYGKPGWTRDCGRRFHRGCDIAPVHPRPTGRVATVWFSDCARGQEYPSEEPVFAVDEPVFAVAAGEVIEAHAAEADSTFGLHLVVRHRWPYSGHIFETLYAHLGSLDVPAGAAVAAGQEIGRMGQSSSSADARNWMAIAPHLHLEVWDAGGRPYDPLRFLERYLPRPE